MSLTNAQVGELLALRAEELTGDRQRAYRRASRAAYKWPEEVADLVANDLPLTELKGIGAKLSGLIKSWLDEPPEIPDPPPLRAGFRSYSEARKILAANPDWADEVNGDLQMHSEESDGSVPIEEMARSGIDLGYSYIAITDHSKGLKIAGGMTEEQFADQGRRIDALNAQLAGQGADFKVLKAIEMNLSPDGSGDMERDCLASLDLVLGSFHSQLRRKEDQTDRYIAGIENPDIDVLGHPRCRIYNFRVGLLADWKTVCDAAADTGTALEIDGFPDRQDLNVELLELARDAGCWISMGTDAHSPGEMQYLPVALAAAISVGIPKDKILNFMSADELHAWVKARRG
ncbi:MAG: putative hydrolase [Actinomycetota bacterium]|jgi:histidinol phosphatase-like PHP family hydrolase|nr:putative hydrolase [Actinomycetota bacterium]